MERLTDLYPKVTRRTRWRRTQWPLLFTCYRWSDHHPKVNQNPADFCRGPVESASSELEQRKHTVYDHRRRINAEEKTKVVAAVWGAEFIYFLAALAIFCLGGFWRIGWIHTFLSNHPGALHPIIQNCPRQNSKHGKEFNKFFPPNRSDDLLSFLLSLSFFYPYNSFCTHTHERHFCTWLKGGGLPLWQLKLWLVIGYKAPSARLWRAPIGRTVRVLIKWTQRCQYGKVAHGCAPNCLKLFELGNSWQKTWGAAVFTVEYVLYSILWYCDRGGFCLPRVSLAFLQVKK